MRLCVLGAVGFLTALGAHVVVTNLPEYGRTHGLGYQALGMMLAAYNLAEIAAKPLSGRLADRIGPLPVMIWGTACFALSCLAYLILPPSSLAGLRVCQGIGAGALSVSSLILVAAFFPARLGGAFGVYNLLKGAGYVAAPLLGGSLGAGGGLRGPFLASGLSGLAILGLQLAAAPYLRVRPSGQSGTRPSRGRLWPWYVANFTDMALLGILLGFVPIRADALGYGAGEIGFLLTGATLFYLAAQPLAGLAADRLGRRPVILAGLLLGSLSTCGLGFSAGWSLWVLATIAALGLGAAWTNSLAEVGEAAGADRIGGDLGLASSCKDAGDIAGPLGLGYAAGWLGLGPAFCLCGMCGCAAAAVVGLATKDTAEHPRG